LFQPVDADATSKGVVVLESKLEEEKSQRKYERFLWILVITILTDCILIKFLDGGFGSFFVCSLSIVLLIAFAKWCEVPWAITYLDQIFHRVFGKPSSSNENNGGEEV